MTIFMNMLLYVKIGYVDIERNAELGRRIAAPAG